MPGRRSFVPSIIAAWTVMVFAVLVVVPISVMRAEHPHPVELGMSTVTLAPAFKRETTPSANRERGDFRSACSNRSSVWLAQPVLPGMALCRGLRSDHRKVLGGSILQIAFGDPEFGTGEVQLSARAVEC